MGTIYTTNWSKPEDWYGMWTCYRIEVKQEVHGWFQRHIWKRVDGGSDVEDWIPTFDHSKELERFTAVAT